MKTKTYLIPKAILLGIFTSSIAYAAPVNLPVNVPTDAANWTGIDSDNGFNITDASFSTLGDAFDDFLLFTINGTTYNPGINADQSTVTVNGSNIGTSITAAKTAVGEVNVTGQYLFYSTVVAGSATTRLLIEIENPTAAAKTVEVVIGGNLGSDEDTAIRATSSGDTIFNAKDIWAISNDDTGELNDPAIAFVQHGPSCVLNRAIANIVVLDQLFTAYTLEIPAGQTRRLATFVQLNTTTVLAATGAETFNSLTSINTANLFADLSSEVQSTIENFGFTNCQADYRTLVTDAINKTKKLVTGKGGKAAKDAAKAADNQVELFSSELTLRADQTEAGLISASDAAVDAVNKAAAAAKSSSDNFTALKAKALRALKKLINKIVAE